MSNNEEEEESIHEEVQDELKWLRDFFSLIKSSLSLLASFIYKLLFFEKKSITDVGKNSKVLLSEVDSNSNLRNLSSDSNHNQKSLNKIRFSDVTSVTTYDSSLDMTEENMADGDPNRRGKKASETSEQRKARLERQKNAKLAKKQAEEQEAKEKKLLEEKILQEKYLAEMEAKYLQDMERCQAIAEKLKNDSNNDDMEGFVEKQRRKEIREQREREQREQRGAELKKMNIAGDNNQLQQQSPKISGVQKPVKQIEQLQLQQQKMLKEKGVLELRSTETSNQLSGEELLQSMESTKANLLLVNDNIARLKNALRISAGAGSLTDGTADETSFPLSITGENSTLPVGDKAAALKSALNIRNTNSMAVDESLWNSMPSYNDPSNPSTWSTQNQGGPYSNFSDQLPLMHPSPQTSFQIQSALSMSIPSVSSAISGDYQSLGTNPSGLPPNATSMMGNHDTSFPNVVTDNAHRGQALLSMLSHGSATGMPTLRVAVNDTTPSGFHDSLLKTTPTPASATLKNHLASPRIPTAPASAQFQSSIQQYLESTSTSSSVGNYLDSSSSPTLLPGITGINTFQSSQSSNIPFGLYSTPPSLTTPIIGNSLNRIPYINPLSNMNDNSNTLGQDYTKTMIEKAVGGDLLTWLESFRITFSFISRVGSSVFSLSEASDILIFSLDFPEKVGYLLVGDEKSTTDNLQKFSRESECIVSIHYGDTQAGSLSIAGTLKTIPKFVRLIDSHLLNRLSDLEQLKASWRTNPTESASAPSRPLPQKVSHTTAGKASKSNSKSDHTKSGEKEVDGAERGWELRNNHKNPNPSSSGPAVSLLTRNNTTIAIPGGSLTKDKKVKLNQSGNDDITTTTVSSKQSPSVPSKNADNKSKSNKAPKKSDTTKATVDEEEGTTVHDTNEPPTVFFDIPEEHTGFVIGKQGVAIKSLMAKTGAFIALVSPNPKQKVTPGTNRGTPGPVLNPGIARFCLKGSDEQKRAAIYQIQLNLSKIHVTAEVVVSDPKNGDT